MDAASPGVPSGSGVRETASISRGAVRLSARLAIPYAPAPSPCVILVHGMGSHQDSMEASFVSRRLLDTRLGTLQFDLSGEGASSAASQEREAAHVEDLETVFKWALARPDVDGEQIGIAAFGPGAVVTVRAVRRRLVSPATIVLVSPEVEPCGFVRVCPPTLVIAGSQDPALDRIRTLANWSDCATLGLVNGAGGALDDAGALEQTAALAADWFNRQFAAGEDLPGYDVGPGD